MAERPILRDVMLRDGTPLRLRSPSPGDFDDIKALYDGLSEDSLHTRFHGYVRTEAPARSDAESDGDTRVVLIGWRAGRVVASGSYDQLREPGVAEVAFTVAEEFQGLGVATRILEKLAEIGAERGIGRFDAEVMENNSAMLAVFHRAGFGVRSRLDFEELLVSMDIQPTEALQDKIGERDHLGVVESLRHILAPASVAVVGVSDEPGNRGGGFFANLIAGGFKGRAVPVDGAGGLVQSVRAAKNLGDLAEPVELVVVAVPEEEVLDVASEVAGTGAKAMLVVSRLTDGAGEHMGRQGHLLEIARSTGLRMMGPGTLGVLNNDESIRLRGTFAGSPPPPGHLAISSQSGAIGIALLGDAADRRLGLSSFVSLGSRSDVSTNDLLEYWEEDEATTVVVLYVDTFGNPEHFGRIARRVARYKPILAIKGHNSQGLGVGQESHTAAALRGDALVDALLLQAGVMRFHSVEELFDTAEFFERQPLPLGPRVGVVSNSIGLSTLAADASGSRGLIVSRSVEVDFHAGPADYSASLQDLLAEETVDAAMAYYVDLGGGDPKSVLEAISEAAARQAKPVVASVLDSDGHPADPIGESVPNFRYPESCAGVLARAVERRRWLSRPLGQRPELDDVDAESAHTQVAAWLDTHLLVGTRTDHAWLPTPECEALLTTHQIPFVASESCPYSERAVSVAASLGGPVVLKADIPPPSHAADLDAVLLGQEGEEAVQAGWSELERRCRAAGREWRGAIVQPLVGPGADVLLGALTDPDLGRVMAIGLGGRRAGLGRDVAYRLLPVTDVDAEEFIDASETLSIQLAGFRGSVPLDRVALQKLILRFAELLRAVPELVEVDLNPVRCLPDGVVVLDMRMRLEQRARPELVRRW